MSRGNRSYEISSIELEMELAKRDALKRRRCISCLCIPDLSMTTSECERFHEEIKVSKNPTPIPRNMHAGRVSSPST
jgi:hypothetical protein